MNPTDLGLPSKFIAYRPGQFEAAIAASLSDKRFTLMSAPAGIGKSLIYMTMAQLIDGRTLVLTGTKGLQQQLTRDFVDIGLFDIRGQNNYTCVAFERGHQFDRYGHPGETCDKGPCHTGLQCGFRHGGCTYYDNVKVAATSRLVVSNYAYWMSTSRYSDPDQLGKFDLLILDEADIAPFELADFCTVELDRDEVRILLSLSLPPHNEGQEVWAEWAEEAYRRCKTAWATAKGELEDILTTDHRTSARHLRRISKLLNQLDEIRSAHKWRRTETPVPNVAVPGMQTDWVVEETENGLQFSPVWAHAYAESYLFRGIPKVALLSATLQPATARYLGIAAESMEYKEFDSIFSARRRPLTYLPTTNVDRNMTEGQIRVWINKIDKIIETRQGRKGIIHARSYDRANLILNRSRFRHLMAGHGRRDAREVVERFKSPGGKMVLVSPSVEAGWDFPGDQCRYQIIAKVPFVDSRSAIVKARAKSDNTYLNYLTARSIMQMVGRGMRSQSDWCETFIIDDHIDWWMGAAKKQKLFPKWFLVAYRRGTSVPPPLDGNFGIQSGRRSRSAA